MKLSSSIKLLEYSNKSCYYISTMNKLGEQIRRLRKERDWTQRGLAKRSGIDRGYLASIETGKVANPSATIFLALARAFNIHPEELYQAAGYIKEAKIIYKESPEEILERLRLASPISIPIYSEFPVHAGELTEPVDYVYRARPRGAPKNIEGYIIHGDCLEPKISDGDIIIVDRDGTIDEGDIVACLTEWGLICGQLKNIGGELYLETSRKQLRFSDCQVAAVVIEVIKRLK